MHAPSPFDSLSISRLLYCYLWPFWLFEDASQGSQLQRAAAFRHNRSKRIYLPGYLLKWSLLVSISLLAVWGLEQISAWPWLIGLAGVMVSLGFVVMVQITVLWLMLNRWHTPA